MKKNCEKFWKKKNFQNFFFKNFLKVVQNHLKREKNSKKNNKENCLKKNLNIFFSIFEKTFLKKKF